MTIGARTVAVVIACTAGCGGSWDPTTRATERAREVLGCGAIELEPVRDSVWRARGCGRSAAIACTSGDNEPRCLRVRLAGEASDPIATAGGASSVGEPEGSSVGEQESSSVSTTPVAPPAAPSASEVAVRAALDARRDDVLACAARERVAVRARWDAAGVVVLALAGDLAGSPEEGCVRAALAGLAAPPGAEGAAIHLVR